MIIFSFLYYSFDLFWKIKFNQRDQEKYQRIFLPETPVGAFIICLQKL